jgi:4-diphosphocytidyl-2-C-methyl-D-erythritol kinase
VSLGHAADPATVRVLAPAKINPRLEVLHARDDGYHDLCTFLVAVDLCDEIEARRTDKARIDLVVDGPQHTPDVTADERNLAWRAAEQVLVTARTLGHVPPETGVDLRLSKRIPSQSGLGGGSSDAAAAWLATARALGLEDSAALEAERDRALARLGSDTVFFARAAETGAAWCTGRGERVAPAPTPRGWSIALVTPLVAASTARVYAALESPLSRRARLPSLGSVDGFPLTAVAARSRLVNDLEPAALSAIAGLGLWRALLDDAGADHFLLSGSGSSFFGLYDDDDAAHAMLETVDRLSRSRGLASRFCDIVHPCGHGARVITDR